ncbi:hypothetical protein K1T71_010128 [Dendrolimus kikuchii]|uniref:Uncharacterized protein n=1 Tax=Dendrolimus kikuchii TaxID=765133 RepID=A0ACC1CRW1_9NEOP|nr:hypothetical protein K1T71_010128 [Dendrolimus kikuchii]
MYFVFVISFYTILNFKVIAKHNDGSDTSVDMGSITIEDRIFNSSLEENVEVEEFKRNCESDKLRVFSNCDETTTKPTTVVTRILTRTKNVLRRNGPFYNFLVNICQVLLTHFSNRKIPLYFNVLSDALKNMGSGYIMKREIKRFRRRLKRISEYHGNLLKEEVQKFLKIITSGRPKNDEFFDIMNSLYTNYEDNKFDDYIYILKKFGKGRSSRIRYETEEVFEKWVKRIFYRQTENVQRNIRIKFGEALIEYKESNLTEEAD